MARTSSRGSRGKTSKRGKPKARRPAAAKAGDAADVAAVVEGILKDRARARVDRANAVIGSLVRALREERGLSKAEVARRAGISPKTVRAIEEGSVSRGALLEHLSKCAHALGCDLLFAMVPSSRSEAVTEVLRQSASSEDAIVRAFAVV